MTFSALKVIQLLKGLQVEFIKHQSNSSSRSLSATAKPLVFLYISDSPVILC